MDANAGPGTTLEPPSRPCFNVFHYNLLISFMFFHVNEVNGEAYDISGTVTSKKNGASLDSVEVIVAQTQQSTFTDLYGNYVLKQVKPGRYTITAFLLGAKTQSVDVQIDSNPAYLQEFSLEHVISEPMQCGLEI